MIDSSSNIPKYVQLADKLEKQIKDGVFKVDEKLLSENELCKMYGISRITVRQALKLLESKKLICTFHGKGTFVRMPALTTHLPEIVSISKKLSGKGLYGYTKIDSFEAAISNPQAAVFLGLDEDVPLSCMKFTTVIEDLPAAAYESYFEASFAKNIYECAQNFAQNKKAFTPYDIYSALGIELDHANQSISAADISVAPQLSGELSKDKALITLSSIFFDKQKKPIEYRTAVYRSDLYSFDITRNF